MGNGLSGYGQDVSRPTLVLKPAGVSSWKEVASGGSGTTCALDQHKAAWCWGRGQYGTIGDGSTIDRLSPTAVTTPSTISYWLHLSLGTNVACGLGKPLGTTSDVEGLAFCWGGCRRVTAEAHALREGRDVGAARDDGG